MKQNPFFQKQIRLMGLLDILVALRWGAFVLQCSPPRRDLNVSVQEAQRRFCSCGPHASLNDFKKWLCAASHFADEDRFQIRDSQSKVESVELTELTSDLRPDCGCQMLPGNRPRDAKVTALHLVAVCATPLPASTWVFGDEQRADNEPPPGSEASH